MKSETQMLREEFYAADLKYEYHRHEMEKFKAEKERIWKRILENKNPELAEIVNVN